MLGYKVVTAAGNSAVFLPATVEALQSVHYREGEWTSMPHNAGALSLFNNLRDALLFAGDPSIRGSTIFEAEYEPYLGMTPMQWRHKQPRFPADQGRRRGYRIESAGITMLKVFPRGTVLAERIRLKRRIWR